MLLILVGIIWLLVFPLWFVSLLFFIYATGMLLEGHVNDRMFIVFLGFGGFVWLCTVVLYRVTKIYLESQEERKEHADSRPPLPGSPP